MISLHTMFSLQNSHKIWSHDSTAYHVSLLVRAGFRFKWDIKVLRIWGPLQFNFCYDQGRGWNCLTTLCGVYNVDYGEEDIFFEALQAPKEVKALIKINLVYISLSSLYINSLKNSIYTTVGSHIVISQIPTD
jgi:hypothetical protein